MDNPKPAILKTSAEALPETPVEAEPTETQPLWFRWSDQYFAGSLACLVLVILLAQWGWFQFRNSTVIVERPVELRSQFSLEINSATAVEWMQLEGIGETVAYRILEDRKKNGKFQSIDDVQRVSGIGKITMAKIRPYLRIDTPTSPPSTPSSK